MKIGLLKNFLTVTVVVATMLFSAVANASWDRGALEQAYGDHQDIQTGVAFSLANLQGIDHQDFVDRINALSAAGCDVSELLGHLAASNALRLAALDEADDVSDLNDLVQAEYGRLDALLTDPGDLVSGITFSVLALLYSDAADDFVNNVSIVLYSYDTLDQQIWEMEQEGCGGGGGYPYRTPDMTGFVSVLMPSCTSGDCAQKSASIGAKLTTTDTELYLAETNLNQATSWLDDCETYLDNIEANCPELLDGERALYNTYRSNVIDRQAEIDALGATLTTLNAEKGILDDELDDWANLTPAERTALCNDFTGVESDAADLRSDADDLEIECDQIRTGSRDLHDALEEINGECGGSGSCC